MTIATLWQVYPMEVSQVNSRSLIGSFFAVVCNMKPIDKYLMYHVSYKPPIPWSVLIRSWGIPGHFSRIKMFREPGGPHNCSIIRG